MLDQAMDEERVLPRAWRDAKDACLSFRGYVASGLALAIAAAIGALLANGQRSWAIVVVTLIAGLGGLLVVVVVAFAVSIIRAPVRQRDEARAELRQTRARRRAPLGIEMTLSPPRSTARGPSEGILTVHIKNSHTHPIEDVLLSFAAPLDVGVARCDPEGEPMTHGRIRIEDGTARCWEAKGVKLYGGGTTNRLHFRVTFPEPRGYEVKLHVTAPGFETITAISTLAPAVAAAS